MRCRRPRCPSSSGHRPQTGHYDSLSIQAAALMQSLAQNHLLVDGNKRVAFALTAIFLRMNGYRVVAKRRTPRNSS